MAQAQKPGPSANGTAAVHSQPQMVPKKHAQVRKLLRGLVPAVCLPCHLVFEHEPYSIAGAQGLTALLAGVCLVTLLCRRVPNLKLGNRALEKTCPVLLMQRSGSSLQIRH